MSTTGNEAARDTAGPATSDRAAAAHRRGGRSPALRMLATRSVGAVAVTVTGVVLPALTIALAAWVSELTWVVTFQPAGAVAFVVGAVLSI